MQFCSSRIRFLIANLNIAVQWCFCEYTDITALNIPQIRITAVSQWTARLNIQRKPKKYWCLLGNLSFGLFDHKKKFQDFSRTFSKVQQNSKIFQDFPGLFFFQIPELSSGNHESTSQREKNEENYKK